MYILYTISWDKLSTKKVLRKRQSHTRVCDKFLELTLIRLFLFRCEPIIMQTWLWKQHSCCQGVILIKCATIYNDIGSPRFTEHFKNCQNFRFPRWLCPEFRMLEPQAEAISVTKYWQRPTVNIIFKPVITMITI